MVAQHGGEHALLEAQWRLLGTRAGHSRASGAAAAETTPRPASKACFSRARGQDCVSTPGQAPSNWSIP
eukprot:9079334-Lingulodinium_polyedra.AAC.1